MKNKDIVLEQLIGKRFTTPAGKTWQFDYEKVNRTYHFIICYKDKRMQVKESDFNKTPIDNLLSLMENTKLI